MRYQETDNVRVLPGVGDAVAISLERLRIKTIGDLLTWYPREYIDASKVTPIAHAFGDGLVTVRAKVVKVEMRPVKGRHLTLVEAVIEDDTGRLNVRWFNQRFLVQKLVPESSWIFIGKLERFGGKVFLQSPIIEEATSILPIYGQTKGVRSKQLRGFVQAALKSLQFEAWDIPTEIRQEEGLVNRSEALRAIHTPESLEGVETSRAYLRYAEVFAFFARIVQAKNQVGEAQGVKVVNDETYRIQLLHGLPFSLTGGQARVLNEILGDMATGHPMTRLLNGDVGSGKTAVAALAAGVVAKSGYQSVFLAPTDILARQHAQSIAKLLPVKVALWTASQKDEGVEAADIVVGTHAVLQSGFQLPRLGLVVVDEQHRFGVRQRQLLRQNSTLVPHVLAMTATPIPRSLALALYGDLSMSVLDERPKNRLPIITEVIYKERLSIIHKRVREELAGGHQVFVICPLIEEKENEEVSTNDVFAELSDPEYIAREQKTVMAEAARIRQRHPEYGVVEVLHGKLKPKEKQAIMERVARGEINVLVATSVIEVGIDIPNATVMIIEGAERFGLAQLHQFRGRVGRGKSASYCYLCPDLHTPLVDQRMRALAEHESGFEVAEVDLSLRGPGDIAGFAQSGLPDFRMATLTDLGFLQRVRNRLEQYVHKHPDFLADYIEHTYSTLPSGLE